MSPTDQKIIAETLLESFSSKEVDVRRRRDMFSFACPCCQSQQTRRWTQFRTQSVKLLRCLRCREELVIERGITSRSCRGYLAAPRSHHPVYSRENQKLLAFTLKKMREDGFCRRIALLPLGDPDELLQQKHS